MDIMEIVLLIAGGIIFILSFFLPVKEDKKNSDNSEKLAREEIDRLVTQKLDAVRSHVDEVVDEAVGYAVEKTERSLERLSNEKIMAVNEYSETVLAEIHKNHEEAMFLYDMLNNKHINLKNTVSEVNRTVKEAEETVNTFQKLVPETAETVPEKTPESGAGETAADNEEAAAGPTEEAYQNGRNSNERILELYRQGKSKVEIAKELGLGVGEVKLVIDLFKS